MRQAMERARPGLPMTDKIKRLCISLLEDAWREGRFKACSQVLCDEAAVFVQNGNKMEARSGYHDDLLMATAFGFYVVETEFIGKPEFFSSGKKLGSATMKGF